MVFTTVEAPTASITVAQFGNALLYGQRRQLNQ